jgi:hypothetical protein
MMTIAGRTVTVSQDGTAGCAFNVSPNTASVQSGGGSKVFTVTNTQGSGCSWTAVSNIGFLTVTNGASGTGSGSVTVSAEASTSSAARSGTVTIAGNTVTMTQDPVVCTFTVSPTAFNAPASGGNPTFAVTAQGSNCTWSAASNSSFLTINSGASGGGSDTVAATVAANSTASSRTGTLTIAGHTITVTQDAKPAAGSLPETPTGGRATRVTTTSTELEWGGSNARGFDVELSTSNPPTTVVQRNGGTTYGAQGLSPGTTYYWRVTARNDVGPVVGPIWSFSTQCSYSVGPSEATVPGSGGTRTFSVSTQGIDACAWTASSNAGFAAITSGSSGTGSGTVAVAVAANAGASRTATLTIAGQQIRVTQDAAACAFTVSPTTVTVVAAGGNTPITVTNTQGTNCSWTASITGNTNGFLSITSGASGTGSGTAVITAAVNSGAARSGTVTIAGRTVSIAQSAAASGVPPEPYGGRAIRITRTSAEIEWGTCGASEGRPCPTEPIRSEILLGTVNPPTQQITHDGSNSRGVQSLTPGTTYYWRIIARNSSGSATGPVWSFTTLP